MRFLATEHTVGGLPGAGAERVNRLVGWCSSRFVTVSGRSAQWLIEGCRVPARKVEIVPNGSTPPDSDLRDFEVQALRDELCGEENLLIGTVSMLRPQKRVDLIVDAFARIESDFPHARLVVVGDGPERAALQKRAAERGVRGIRFLGYRDDVRAVLAALDVFVMASEAEGSPLALIEAMHAGLAIVATRVGGIPEIAPDAECAVLVPPDDVESLAAAVARVLSDGDLRASLGGSALARAQRELGFERMVDGWSGLYGRVVEERRRRSAWTMSSRLGGLLSGIALARPLGRRLRLGEDELVRSNSGSPSARSVSKRLR
jgi:glycosyltransferase involved in cell wall biosynthesis